MPEDHGFTLIELVVVCSLISLVLFLSIPRLEKVHTAESMRQASQWLVINIPRLRERAVREQIDLSLHLDMQDGILWVSSPGMTGEQRDAARKDGFRLSESIRIMDVQFPGEPVLSDGSAEIRFYSRGFSDRAWIHLAEDDRKRSFLVETFLNDVEQHEGYLGFEP